MGGKGKRKMIGRENNTGLLQTIQKPTAVEGS